MRGVFFARGKDQKRERQEDRNQKVKILIVDEDKVKGVQTKSLIDRHNDTKATQKQRQPVNDAGYPRLADFLVNFQRWSVIHIFGLSILLHHGKTPVTHLVVRS